MILVAQIETPDVEQAKEVGLQAVDTLGDFFGRIADGGYLSLVVFGCFAVIAIVGSGAMASSIAESRIRGRNLHFFIGMLIPILYPLLILVILPHKTFEKEEVTEMHMSGSAGEDIQESAFDVDSPLNYDFFHASMFDDTGNPRGPFIMMVDNVELRVERIAEVMPQVVVLETMNANGKLQTMRLPFGRISVCREI